MMRVSRVLLMWFLDRSKRQCKARLRKTQELVEAELGVRPEAHLERAFQGLLQSGREEGTWLLSLLGSFISDRIFSVGALD
jgi:hypothetical protein